jgi:hypothetical protein
MAEAAGDDSAPEHSKPLEREQQLRDSMRQLGNNHPTAHAQRGEVRLVAEALDEPGRVGDDALEVEV